MDFDEKMMTLVVHGATVPMIHVNTTAWFRAKDCALILGYKDSKKAIKAHVEQEWQETLARILEGEGVKCPPYLSDLTSNDLSAKWITESGLYELCCSSKLPLARTFKERCFQASGRQAPTQYSQLLLLQSKATTGRTSAWKARS